MAPTLCGNEYWWTNGENRLIKTANDDMMIVMAVVTRKKALNQNMEAGHWLAIPSNSSATKDF